MIASTQPDGGLSDSWLMVICLETFASIRLQDAPLGVSVQGEVLCIE